ncbi:MAG: Rpn family recombination-promoting nuclease/putative transposase [Chitinophagaceae bacterium]|nr:Rpn family recombination-promoting nuclease/putative transposase [Chitinophagaceae bacterium]
MASDYFKNYLPAAISRQLDFTSLEQLPDTYLSGELKKTMSDIVYSCLRKDGKGAVKVSLLIEHKSYPDKYTPVQIGSYIFSALQKQATAKEPLSLVIPVLLYHGKDKR